MEKDEIIIRNAIIHILDSSMGMPVLSDVLLETGPDMNDFLRDHIFKIASSDDIKQCNFNQEEFFMYELIERFEEEKMIPLSKEIANCLYTIMNQNIDIPPADLLVVTYQINSTIHLALLKMNYKESHIHYTGSGDSGNSNEIIKQRVTIPSQTTKLSEAVLINLEDYSIELVERKFEVNGIKMNYLSQVFLQCQSKLSTKAKLTIITKAIEQINEKYYESDFDRKMETKSIICFECLEQGALIQKQ